MNRDSNRGADQTNSRNYSNNSSSFNQERKSDLKNKISKRVNNKEESSDTYSDFKYEERSNRFTRRNDKMDKESGEDDDLISESSSFSKFSLGSQREVGKIGVRR